MYFQQTLKESGYTIEPWLFYKHLSFLLNFLKNHYISFQTLCLRQNLVKTIEGLSTLVHLRELDLYDNQITKIENLEVLVNLE